MTDGQPVIDERGLDAKLWASLLKILEWVVRTPEIAEEIKAASLSPRVIISEVLCDPFFRSRARGRYKAVVDRTEKLAKHERQRPSWFPSGWHPTRKERVALGAAILLPILFVVVMFSWLSPAPLIVHLIALTIIYHFEPGTRLLLKTGLPKVTWDRLQWGRRRRALRLEMPFLHYDWKQAVREEVVLPEVREKINQMRRPVFDHDLAIRDASGLRSADDLSFVIETVSVAKFIREIDRLKTGSIALAGPRGVGKTTLIRALAEDMFPRGDQPPRMTVTASAPARYEPRDFVLHLHATVCKAVLDRLRFNGPQQDAGAAYERWEALYRRARRRNAWARGFVLFGKGCVWLLLAAAIAVGLWYRNIDMILADVLRVRQTSLGSVLDYAMQEPWQHATAALVLAFGVVRASLYFLAVVSIVILRACAPVLRNGVMRVQLLRHSWQSSLARQVLVDLLIRAFSLFGFDQLAPKVSRLPNASAPVVGGRRQLDSTLVALRVLAEEQLRRIRFLQTRTEGWSGKLSTPKGAGMGWERSVQRAEQPLTHPEVVEQFRDFLERAAKVLVDSGEISGLTIAIDELDKIANPQEAHEFINEIKGVFGVDQCLFVVSVSEDALTSFERRGIPVRDALDSAFTVMIAVEPFVLDESRHWLSRRVIGLPEPFICLCHCLAGGMPRELSRTATAIHDLLLDHEELQLEHVTRLLIIDDLGAKIRAFSYSTQQLGSASDVSEFVIKLNNGELARSDTLMLQANELIASDTTNTDLNSLRWEAASYHYFCATLLEFFDADLDESTLTVATCGEYWDGSLTQLARARQAMAVAPELTWQLLTGFRESRGLSVSKTASVIGK